MPSVPRVHPASSSIDAAFAGSYAYVVTSIAFGAPHDGGGTYDSGTGARSAVALRANLSRSIASATATRTSCAPRIGWGLLRFVGSRRLKSRCSNARAGVYRARTPRGSIAEIAPAESTP